MCNHLSGHFFNVQFLEYECEPFVSTSFVSNFHFLSLATFFVAHVSVCVTTLFLSKDFDN